MTKKKTNKTAKTASTKKQKIEAIDKLSKVAKGKVVTIPDDAIINIFISGDFKKAIEETLHFVMSDMAVAEIIVAMKRIREGFKGVDPQTVTNAERACWVLMSLVSEINHQAAIQEKTVITNEDRNETMADAINALDTDAGIADIISENVEYRKFRSERDKTLDDLTKSNDNKDEND